MYEIRKLKEKEIGYGFISNDNNKYYICTEESAGSHSYTKKEEITKEKYDYISALILIEKVLTKK